MSSELVEAEQRASTYIQTQGPQTYQALQVALREVCLLRTKATNVGLLHQTQHIFEQGEKTGHLQAWLAKEQSVPVSIPCIADSDGAVLIDLGQINDCFVTYYKHLYTSKMMRSEGEVYLDKIDLPCLTTSYRDKLGSPITLEEIQLVVKTMQTGKSPGPDRLWEEFFQNYANSLLPSSIGCWSICRIQGPCPCQ